MAGLLRTTSSGLALRLTVFLPSLAGGGAERSIGTVANGLAERGVEVDLVLARADGPFLGEVSSRVRVVDLGCPSVMAAIPGLVRHLRGTRPNALLAAMSHANVAAALAHRLARSAARLVLSERVHLASMLDEHRSLRMRLTWQLMRLTYPLADRIVAVSDGVANDLARHFGGRERIETIYNPVVQPRLVELAAQAPSHRWLQQREAPVVLAAGRLIPQKDFATLIEAFALLRRQRDAKLVILGEGELRGTLVALAERLGVGSDVDLPGFDPNPYSAMRRCDLFVLSSRYEGLPGVLIQAMACGARVVSTDCPSGPDEVLQGGRWGRLVPVADPGAMAAAMAATLDDPQPPDVESRAAAFSAEAAVAAYAHVLGLDPARADARQIRPGA